MRENAEINVDQLFAHLKILFNASPYPRADLKRLDAALEYWEKKHFDDDDRKLAYGLAAIHHKNLEPNLRAESWRTRLKDYFAGVVRQRKLRPQLQPRSRLSLSLLNAYFDTAESVWSKVKVTDGRSAGETATFDLADRFYTALSKIRPITLQRALIEELKQLRKDSKIEDDSDLKDVFREMHESRLSALCFSGGGIRSATFGLGIIQGLAENRHLKKFDYLSTVSGGGYLGSWLSAWVLREKINELTERWRKKNVAKQLEATPKDLIEEGSGEFDLTADIDKTKRRELGIRIVEHRLRRANINNGSANPEPTQLQHLREYSNYMSPRVGLLSADTWTLVTIYLRNLFLNLTIFIPLIAAVLMLPRFLLLPAVVAIPSARVAWGTLLLGIISGSYALFFVISRLPSKNVKPNKTNFSESIPSQAGPGEVAGTETSQVKAAAEEEKEIKATAETDAEKALEDDDGLLDEEDKHTDLGVLLRGVFPLVITAFCAMALWSWNVRSNQALYDYFDVFRFDLKTYPNYVLVYTMIGAGVAFLVCLVILLLKKKADVLSGIAALISACVGGLLLWLVAVKMTTPAALSAKLASVFGAGAELYEWQIYFCLALPIFLAITLIVAAVFVGLTSGKMNDADREWLARYGGWVLIVSVVWIISNALVLMGPSLLSAVFRINWSDLSFTDAIGPTIVSLAGIASAVISLFGGFSAKSSARAEPAKTKSERLIASAPKVAAVIFLGFIFIGIASLTTLMIYAVGNFFWNGDPSSFGGSWSHVPVLKTVPVWYLLGVFVGLSIVGLVMACFVNVNKFSLHGAYRDRLVRAYLGASNPERNTNSFTGFDESDNFQLHRLKDQKPLHVINATLNLVGGKTLAWQNRKAATFTMSPLHCGSPLIGYRATNEYCRNEKLGACQDRDACNISPPCALIPGTKKPNCQSPGKALRLGTAMAISGAAANPNMGYYSSSVVTFLMSLFNIRLGWWLGNTNEKGARLDYWHRPFFSKSSPTVAVLPLLNETLGRTDENKRYINVTDGGHFENLALYEMVLRRCRFILLSDGAADFGFKFGEIANAIQKCKVDLGVDIQFVGSMNIRPRSMVKEDATLTRSRFAIARIKYPEKFVEEKKNERTGKTTRVEKNRTGWLVYTRPTYYENEPRDIMNYAESNLRFPHQSTGDQMYDEKQFEAYRGLGFLTMSEIQKIFVATSKGDPDDEVDDSLENLFAEDDELRETVFGFFGLGAWDSYQSRKKKVKKVADQTDMLWPVKA